jgi:hypothetical protein
MPNWKKLVVSGSDASLNSLNVNSFVSASAFVGDGSQLTGIVDNSTFRTSLSGASSYTVTHSLGEQFCQVSVFDSNKELTLPGEVSIVDSNNIYVAFDEAFTGNIVIKS